ncbi:hypothetical protein BC332_15845 [Capsicum chinense]|nr:hypothetical protein BC332_15845 [Capsicum chinense]
MESDALLVESIMIEHWKRVFEGLKSLVDVGGGNGVMTKAIANAFLQINCTIFELPHVIEGVEGCKNLAYVGGDMFKSIPYANAILLKERNEQEWTKLFSDAGFSDYKIVPILGLRSVIEVNPKILSCH